MYMSHVYGTRFQISSKSVDRDLVTKYIHVNCLERLANRPPYSPTHEGSTIETCSARLGKGIPFADATSEWSQRSRKSQVQLSSMWKPNCLSTGWAYGERL